MREPEGTYETHFSPSSGSGHAIGVEMASVVRFSVRLFENNAPDFLQRLKKRAISAAISGAMVRQRTPGFIMVK